MATNYNEFISYPFTTFNIGRNQFPSILDKDVTLNDNAFNKINIKVDIHADTIEIPCPVLGLVSSVLSNKRRYPNIHKEDSILIPLFKNRHNYYGYRNENPKEVKSANPLLKELFIPSSINGLLGWCKCADTLYYGAPGLLFYEDMTPLIMFTILIEKLLDGRYKIIKPIIRISPRVYTNNDLMAKHIRTKMLCSMMDMKTLSYTLYAHRTDLFDTCRFQADFNIIIDDFYNDWFEIPSVPNINVTSKSINDFLVANFTEDDL